MSARRTKIGWHVLGLHLLLAITLGGGFLAPQPVGAAPSPSPLFTEADLIPGQLVVGYRKVGDVNALLQEDGVQGLHWRSELSRLGVALLNVEPGQESEMAARLAGRTGIRFVEPNYRVAPFLAPSDTLYAGQYAHGLINSEAAWDITTGLSAVTIAIIDSGIELSHPEFAGRLVSGYDFVERDHTPQDVCGHGTHVAGIAAAAGNNSQGVAGVAWGVRIMPLRVLDGYCIGSTADVAAALVWAADNGADVINLSLGTSAPSSLMENGTYYAYSKGVVVVAAGGNAGTSPLFYPAAHPWVLAVGATDTAGDRGVFSNTGPELDLMAPGVDILSTTPSGYFYYQTLFGTSATYGELSGSSMAAPFVAGAAALLAGLPAFDSPNKIYQALMESALDMEVAGRDDNTGYGLLQIDAALGFSPTVSTPTPWTPGIEYDILNSHTCINLVTYDWQTTTTALPVFGSNGWTTVALPFTFEFGGVDYTDVTVSANGYLTFGGSGGVADNFLLPGIAQPNEVIAPFWDNLNPSAGGQIYGNVLGSAPDRLYVVEWRNIPRAGFGERVTVQALLYETSHEIKFQYRALSGSGATGSSATIGLEYDAGQSAAQYSYNQKNAVAAGQALLFVPMAPLAPRLSDGCVAPEAEETVDLPDLEALRQKVGPAGGTFGLQPFCVNLPAGLLQEETILSIELLEGSPRPQPGWVDLQTAAEITLRPRPDYSLGSPLVCYRYTAQDLLKAGGNPANLFLAYYNPASRSWEQLPTRVDASRSLLLAVVPHFSMFGVFAAQPNFLPETGALLAWDTLTCLPMLALGAILLGWLALRRRQQAHR